MREKGIYSVFSYNVEYFNNFGGGYYKQEYDYVMNLKTGKSNLLTEKEFIIILKKEDDGLYNSFKIEPLPKTEILRYMKMLNKKLAINNLPDCRK